MQSKAQLETWYRDSDPWKYETNKDDAVRKENIIRIAKEYCPGDSVVDIGAGEGWVTKDLPYTTIYATDLSDTAQSRFPENVKPWNREPVDVAMTMGTLYKQYDHETIAKQLKNAQATYILVAGIHTWLKEYDFGKIIHVERFPYREYEQRVTVYEKL